MSSDAEREAVKMYPHSLIATVEDFREVARYNFVAGVEWERSRPVSDQEVNEAAHVLWQADDSEMETSWLSNRNYYMETARAALEAAAKVRAQGGTE